MEAKRLCSRTGLWWRQMHPAAPIFSANYYLVRPLNSLTSPPSSAILGHYFFFSPCLSFLSLNFGFISFTRITTLHIIILNLNFETLHGLNVIMAYVILWRMHIRFDFDDLFVCVCVCVKSFKKGFSMKGSSQLQNYSPFLGILSDHQKLNCILEACKFSSDFKTAFQSHAKIIKFGYETYPSLIASLVSTYAYCDCLDLAHQLLDEMPYWGFDLITANLIIASLMKVGEFDFAKRVFRKMPSRDVVTWNSMIGGCVRNERFEEALRFFREMLNSNVEPDGFTFASVITSCARLGSSHHAELVHGLMVEKKIQLNFILSSALIDMYSKCGRINTAKKVFNSIQHDDVSVWNSMINGLAIHGLALDAIGVFSQMEMESVSPDSITFIGILTACSHCGLVEQGLRYFDLMRRHYLIQPQLEHYGAIVDLLGRAGLVEEAYAKIKAMPMEPDIVIWRALLSACRNFKKPEFGEVAIAKISHLNSGDYILLSNMYCYLEKWDSAERVREMMKRDGVRKNRGKSWVELGGAIHQFKAGDRSHSETEAIYKVLEGLIRRTKLEGFMPATDLVLMDVSDEEKEENLNSHSEKLALAYVILKTSPGTEIRVSKNLRTCHDCHCWMKMLSRLLSRVIIVRDRIRFHQFEGGLCSCRDYW